MTPVEFYAIACALIAAGTVVLILSERDVRR